MDKEVYLKELVSLQDSYDTESAHGRADNILCEILKELGHEDIVEAYDKIGKWYA